MALDAIDKAEALTYHAVSLVSSEGDDKLYTDWDQSIQIGADTYESVPDMEIKLPINDGLLNEQDGRIGVPFIDDVDDLTHRMTSGEPHADVTMRIFEVYKDPTGSVPTVENQVFVGVLVKGRRNYEGRPDLVMLQAISEKGLISKASQGIQCNHECANTLGDRFCQVVMAPFTFTITITSIDAGELTVTGIPSGKDDFHFQRGSVESLGLVINIQEWRNAANGDETKVQLMRQAPQRWIGRSVTIKAGCDKSIEICRSRFDNEEHSRMLGFGMPAYDPQFEGDPTLG